MTTKMTLDTLATMVQKGFLDAENKMAKQEDLLATREELHELTGRVGRLEERVEYGFAMVTQEFKDIRSQLKSIDVLGADVFGLRLRVAKIEKRPRGR